MKIKNHLPLLGVGPIYVVTIMIITIVLILASKLQLMCCIKIDFLEKPFLFIGIVFIIIGVLIWYQAKFQSKIEDSIKKNMLNTTGIYAIVRNPIYTAFLFVCTGMILIINNALLLFLPFLYWIYLTVLMKFTEEKWLIVQYGQDYIDYCKKVNRIIPWF